MAGWRKGNSPFQLALLAEKLEMVKEERGRTALPFLHLHPSRLSPASLRWADRRDLRLYWLATWVVGGPGM